MTKTSINREVGVELAQLLPKDSRPWYRVPHLLQLNLFIGCALQYSSATGYDGSMMNGLQSLSEWQTFMSHPTGAWLGFVAAAASIGQIFGYVPSAYVMNRHGRKISIYVGTLLIIGGALIQGLAVNATMFIVGRIIVGHGSAWVGSAPTLITEIAYPTHRGKVTSLYNCCYYVGTIIAAWVTFGTRNLGNNWTWRVPSLVQIAVPLGFLLGIFMMPESPRWLVSKNRIAEARQVLVKYHAGGDEDSPLVAFELREIEQTLELERLAQNTSSYAHLATGKGNRHRLFITVTLGIFAQWSGNGIVAYYLALILASVGITSVTQQTLLNGFLQVWNLIIAVIAASMVDRLGRRFLFLTSSIGMLCSYIVITGLSGSFANTGTTAVGTAVIPFLFIYYAFYDIAYTPLLVAYPAEIWPYVSRARGVAVALTATLLAVFFNVFINPIALKAIAWKYYIVYIVILVVIVITVYFSYPETRGHSLEEMARIFDGEEADIPDNGEILSEIQQQNETCDQTFHIEVAVEKKA